MGGIVLKTLNRKRPGAGWQDRLMLLTLEQSGAVTNHEAGGLLFPEPAGQALRPGGGCVGRVRLTCLFPLLGLALFLLLQLLLLQLQLQLLLLQFVGLALLLPLCALLRLRLRLCLCLRCLCCLCPLRLLAQGALPLQLFVLPALLVLLADQLPLLPLLLALELLLCPLRLFDGAAFCCCGPFTLGALNQRLFVLPALHLLLLRCFALLTLQLLLLALELLLLLLLCPLRLFGGAAFCCCGPFTLGALNQRLFVLPALRLLWPCGFALLAFLLTLQLLLLAPDALFRVGGAAVLQGGRDDLPRPCWRLRADQALGGRCRRQGGLCPAVAAVVSAPVITAFLAAFFPAADHGLRGHQRGRQRRCCGKPGPPHIGALGYCAAVDHHRRPVQFGQVQRGVAAHGPAAGKVIGAHHRDGRRLALIAVDIGHVDRVVDHDVLVHLRHVARAHPINRPEGLTRGQRKPAQSGL